MKGSPVRALFVVALLCASPPAAAGGAQRPKVPVLIGGEESSEGCAGTAVVAVRPDSWLNLRSGPGRANPVIARLQPDQTVSVCQRRGNGWVGVVVHPADRRPADCGLSDAGSQAKAYRGPCRSGWVSERYLRIQAG